MKIAVYTLTRDRLEYTQRCFAALRERAGYAFDHYVVDNGSQDGTQAWLRQQQHEGPLQSVLFNAVNLGISAGSNQALDRIAQSPLSYDLVVKLDNDCELVSPDLFARMVDLYEAGSEKGMPVMLLSPRVEGINSQPVREYHRRLAGYTIGRTGIVGGLCHWLPALLYLAYRYPLELPLAKWQDDAFCDWAYKLGVEIGYVEELVVAHIDGTDNQALKYPEYFRRKGQEESVS